METTLRLGTVTIAWGFMSDANSILPPLPPLPCASQPNPCNSMHTEVAQPSCTRGSAPSWSFPAARYRLGLGLGLGQRAWDAKGSYLMPTDFRSRTLAAGMIVSNCCCTYRSNGTAVLHDNCSIASDIILYFSSCMMSIEEHYRLALRGFSKSPNRDIHRIKNLSRADRKQRSVQ